MVLLKNIFQEGIYVFADCYAEGKEDRHFTIKIDIKANQVVDYSCEEYDCYVSHAKYCVMQYIKQNKPLPKESTSMWV